MVNRHRYSMSGLDAVEESKHGHEMARERYGAPKYEHGAAPPVSRQEVQSPGQKGQYRVDSHADGYDNDVSSHSWLRGGGDGGATGKSNFDRENSWRQGRDPRLRED